MDKKHIKNLIKLQESECLEFKRDDFEPLDIGKNISAISNSLVLLERQNGYIIWGVSDNNKVLGTSFKPTEHKVENEELKNWLLTQLQPQVMFFIHEETIDNCNVVIFEIPQATLHPVRFKGADYIRIGSYTKNLRDHPEEEREVWKHLSSISFEKEIAIENITADKVLEIIDYCGYFKAMKIAIPESHSAILERLISEKFIIQKNGSDVYSITNLGVILFCNDMEKFPHFSRRSPRVIVYKGTNKVQGIREKEFTKGYALDFDNIVDYIDSQIPKNEEIGRAFRKETSMYPKAAIRELVANALIHQDFHARGPNLLIEIFLDRIEISNPGKPFIDTLRFIDEAPNPRNPSIMKMMRKMNISEDRGSGIDKVILEIELHQLPPPNFRITTTSTVATLYGIKKFKDMTSEEKTRACYQHACLQWVSGKPMTNETLRSRFKLEKRQYTLVNKILVDAIKQELIKKEGDVRWARYKPYWA